MTWKAPIFPISGSGSGEARPTCALIRGFPEDRGTWARQVEAFKSHHPSADPEPRSAALDGGGPGAEAEAFAEELCALLREPARKAHAPAPAARPDLGTAIQPFVPVHGRDRTELYSHAELSALAGADARNELDEMSEPQRYEKDQSGPG